jgi:hypothetical protein
MQHSVFLEAWLRLWLRLLTQTMQGGGLNTFRFATAWNSHELLNRWAECFLPKAEISRPDAVRGWIEDWWNLMGVVPRSLYLEQLERKEVLRTRLEEAEATIQQLRDMTGLKGQETQANEIANAWETSISLWQTAIQTTLKAQNEWLRTWADIALNNNHQRG